MGLPFIPIIIISFPQEKLIRRLNDHEENDYL